MRIATIGSGLGAKASRSAAALLAGAVLASACTASDDAIDEPSVATPDAVSRTDATATTDSGPAATIPLDTARVETAPPASDTSGSEPPPSPTEGPVAAPDLVAEPSELVRILASDEYNGRNNQTPGSAASRDLLVSLLSEFASPAVPDGNGGLGFLQEYAVGTNVIGVVAGRGALANEYVMIGAHYDHLGPGECDTLDERDDVICNGAADNAAGVASAMDLAGRIHRDPGGDGDRRGLVISFWDGEEDGLVGARRYVADPVIPLGQITTYVNFDIQGASLLPALSNHTLLIGSETGGAALLDVASRATDASPLEYTLLSVFFGQSRSDHAPFVDAGVPALFFTDGNNGCYHTVLDDFDHYDGAKHLVQIDTAEVAVRELLGAPDRPEFDGDGPRTTFDDAVELLELVKAGGEELAELPDRGVATVDHLIALDRILGAGPEAYDAAAEERVLTGASDVGAAFTNSECRRP